MYIKSLKLQNFRNYADESFAFDPAVNLICGENGQGKTNLLEAAAACSTMRLFRTAQKKEGLRFGENHAFIFADFLAQERDVSLELRFSRTKAMEIYKNGVRQKRQSDAQGLLKTVLFCPEDLALIKAGAAERRSFLDHAICQLRPRYAEALAQYHKLLDHKTRILRDWEKHPSLLDVLEDFNEAMARAGALVIHYRAHFVRKLAEKAAQIQTEFSGGRETLALHYATVSTVRDPLGPTVELYEDLRRHQNSHARAERDARSCLSGPHKDDLMARINGQPARQYASQGQTRTAALSLKLAERELFRDDTGQWPILLLDDVLSELDARRQDFVLRRITGGQVILTGCEAPDGTFPEGRTLHIVQGKLVNDPETGKIPVFQDKKDSDSSEPS